MLGIVGKILQFVKNIGYCGMHDEHIFVKNAGRAGVE
jgi:hypothetical protein